MYWNFVLEFLHTLSKILKNIVTIDYSFQLFTLEFLLWCLQKAWSNHRRDDSIFSRLWTFLRRRTKSTNSWHHCSCEKGSYGFYLLVYWEWHPVSGRCIIRPLSTYMSFVYFLLPLWVVFVFWAGTVGDGDHCQPWDRRRCSTWHCHIGGGLEAAAGESTEIWYGHGMTVAFKINEKRGQGRQRVL